jgi:hypothetical protein
MTLDEVLLALEWSRLAEALKASFYVYPVVNAAHILGIALLVGAIAALDLRLLGAFRGVPVQPLSRALVPVSAAGLGLAVGAGILLFSVRASDYAANPAFRLKLVLVFSGVANALLLRRGEAWRTAEEGLRIPLRVRIAAALSLALWCAAILAGRFIGFLE